VPLLHVVSRPFSPDLPRFTRGCFDEFGGARLDRIRGLIDPRLQVVQLDAGALGQLTVATPDCFAQRYP